MVELDDLAQVMSLARVLEARRETGPAILDVVPAARTILVRFHPDQAAAAMVAEWIRNSSSERIDQSIDATSRPGLIELPVVYDGADLDEVGQLTGLGREGVITAHTGQPWTVAFLGFAPGFAYCTGGDPRLRVPRRSAARQRVPAGSIGLADVFTAVYPRASPGGWQLLGHTDVPVWDLERDPPARLTPGWIVRFRAT
jgi:KipI family sensor histidine kinase inhibitor